jgi:hypothetical protein
VAHPNDWQVPALSAAGICFILLGLLALALPGSQEGVLIWRLDGGHSVNWMDLVGVFATGLGVILTWLSGLLWKQQTRV